MTAEFHYTRADAGVRDRSNPRWHELEDHGIKQLSARAPISRPMQIYSQSRPIYAVMGDAYVAIV